jgi:photosystem II stability/assembly factor-like uncharacterized protein
MIRKRILVVSLVVALSVAWLPLAAAGPRWRPIGPEGASVQALAVGPGVVYAGTQSGGVFKSTDGGGSWTVAGGGNQGLSIRGLALHPSDGRRVLAATIEGVFRTVDGGDRWARTGGFSSVAVASAPSDPNVFYAGLRRVFRSEDGGATWAATGEGPDFVSALAVDPTDSRVVYAGSSEGFFRSFDGGATWEASNAGLTLDGVPQSVRVLAVDPRSPATLWAATTIRVFKSTTRGTTWSAVEGSLGTLMIPMSIAVDPASGAVWVGGRGFQGDGGVYRSGVGGAAWSRVFQGPSVQALAVDPGAPGRLFVGSEALGVLRSEDGERGWEQANNGLRALMVRDLEVDPRGPGRVFALASTTLSSRGGPAVLRGDGHGSWDTVLGNVTDPASGWFNDVAVSPGRPGTLFVGEEDGVRKSVDGGTTWLRRNEGLRTGEWVSHVAVAPSDPERVYALGWGSYPLCDVEDCPRVILYGSENGGASWTAAARLDKERPNALMVDPENPRVVYVGGSRLWKSLNGGASWEPGVRGPRGAILSLAADPEEPDILYAGVYVDRGRRLWKSVDGGKTWRPASAGLPQAALVLRLVPDPTKSGMLYAATDRGVYVSANRAGRWAPLRDGLTTSLVFTLAVDPRGGRGVYAGTNGGSGVFVLEGR